MSTKKVEAVPWPDDVPEAIPFDDTSDVEAGNADREESANQLKRLRAEVVKALQEPIDTTLVKKRLVNPNQPKSRQNPELEYLEWPTVVRNLNRIFGYGQWSTQVVRTDYMGQQPKSGAPYMVVATVSLSVTFPDYGSAEYTNVGTGEVRYDSFKGLDMAVKGAVWDGVKRCATALGEQFGLSLYDKDTPETEDEPTEEQTTSVRQFKPRSTPPSTDKSGVGDSFECEDCGKEVKGYTSKAGKTYTATDLYNMSVKYAGAGYCYECKQKHQA